MSRTRISITLPPKLVEAADQHAAQQDRSRSWVIAEALEAYLRQVDRAGEPASIVGLGERATVPYVARGLGEQRLAQLEADLALTPEQRVREAEATARLNELRDTEPKRDRILMFARYEDYLAWDRWEELTPP